MRLLLIAVLVSGCAATNAAGRRWVHAVDVEGNTTLPASTITAGLYTAKTSWVPLADKQWLDDAELDEDKRRIQATYAEHGFFDAKVETIEVKERKNRESVDVVVRVIEGPRTHLSAITLEGLNDTLELELHEGDPFDHARYLAAKALIVDHFKRRGFAYARCDGDVRVDKEQHTATITLRAARGPKVILGRTLVEGNGKIPFEKILNAAEWRAGEVYDPEDFDATVARLYNFGVFAAVTVKLPETPPSNADPLVADVTIAVEPGLMRELRLGGGIGIERRRQDVHLRGEWILKNFGGGLRTLRLTLRPAYAFIPAVWAVQSHGPAGVIEAQLTQPDTLGTQFNTYITVGFDLQIQEGYQYYGPRVTPGLERTFWRDRIRAGASYSFQFLQFFNVDPVAFDPVTTPLGLGFQNPYRLAYLEEYVALDLRDRPLDTRSGVYAEIRAEQGLRGLGSAFTYFKLKPEVRGYIPIGERVTLALRAMLGWMRPGDGDDATEANQSPVTRRFVLGGPSSHRGFTVGRLSPQVPRQSCFQPGEDCVFVPVGGHGALLFSFDVRVRVVKLAGSWLGIVPFVDAGDVTVRFADLDLKKLHWATGASLIYESPIGEVRLGLGARLNRLSIAEDDGTPNPDSCANTAFLHCAERFAFHLSIGGAF